MKADIKYNNKTGADIRQRQIVENCGRSAGRGNCAGGDVRGRNVRRGQIVPWEIVQEKCQRIVRKMFWGDFRGDITEIVRGEIVHVRLRHSDHIDNRLLAAYKYYI